MTSSPNTDNVVAFSMQLQTATKQSTTTIVPKLGFHDNRERYLGLSLHQHNDRFQIVLVGIDVHRNMQVDFST